MTIAELKLFFSQDTKTISVHPGLADYGKTLLDLLQSGELRTATRDTDGNWQVNAWVKAGILCLFRASELELFPAWPGGASDKSLFPPRHLSMKDKVRMVPGGSAVRRGACVQPGVVIMPPAYINVGAWVGANTMVDSHALVGSCAQVGANVHLSAGAQIGGVLEPAGKRPVIVEDGCFLGALSGLFEGIVMRERAVLAPGVILTASTTIFDLVVGREWRGEIPPAAVVVPGSRPAGGAWAQERGLALYAPCIVKYRDTSTDAATCLEEALR
jgi:2,3,4,5-tetrahydropyridine-2-carboxylate N-succinyltransferase